ncbi:MAG: hypothetical protein KF910_04200 [Brevundimonas sp.]|uniref:hypothetical protein n=1 Tax=Brevundimonas sp. TaxID=1871086 RepID=UPI0025C6C9D8|nr:hypothetical protein [Brevundimonas sp.]MBX3476783.1 hypothetical protein [Brevundimonas sp.]
MLTAPDEDPQRTALDAALRSALTARLALGEAASSDAAALALRAVLAGTTPAEGAVLKAAWGRMAAADRPLVVWGAAAQVLAADRFGLTARLAAEPEQALEAAAGRATAVLDLTPARPWWGRLLARPELKVTAALPDDAAARPRALIVARAQPGPTGDDRTFWITDSARPDAEIAAFLAQAGLAAQPLTAGGGLKLFLLAGYVQAEDGRLNGAPGDLTGVIGAAPVF